MSGRASALRRARAVAVVSLAVAAVMPLGAAQAAPAQTGCNARVNNTYPKLLECVRLSEVRAHQAALQAIADDNDGHRFSGFEGYNESVDYVVDTLRASGYDPQVQTFDYLAFQPVGPSVLQQVAPNTITYVENTDFGLITQSDSGDVTANVTAVDLQLGIGNTSTSGCEDADFAELPGRQHRAPAARHVHLRDQGRDRGSTRRRRDRDLQPGQHGRRRPPGHPGRHADGQQHERHPGARDHLRAGRDAVPDGRAADAGVRQLAARDPAHRQRDRREGGRQPRQRRDGRRAPRLGARRPGHQRQRLRQRRDPRGGAADRQGRHAEHAPLRVVGRRGERPGRLDELRQRPQPGGAGQDRALPQLRHGRVAELRLHDAGRRPVELRGAGRRADRARPRSRICSSRSTRRRTSPTTTRRSTGAATTSGSSRSASRPAASSPARRSARPPSRRTSGAARSAPSSTPATTRPATRSPTTTTTRWTSTPTRSRSRS